MEKKIVRNVEVPSTWSPKDQGCPNCNAAPGSPCTQPTGNSRRPVTWYHYSRMVVVS